MPAMGIGLLFAAFSMNAATINFDFTTSGGTNAGSGFGNVRTYSSGGLTLTATAWSVTGNNNTTFQNSQLGWYSGNGLGVCNRNEDTGCDSPEHQVDNYGSYDFVLFQFSLPIDPLTITIRGFGSEQGLENDKDVTYFLGNLTSGNLTGKTLGDLTANPLNLTAFNDSGAVSPNPRTVNIQGGSANAILFGASVASTDRDDFFKIQSMTVSNAPEPGTMVLLGGALIAFSGYLRRKNRQSGKIS